MEGNHLIPQIIKTQDGSDTLYLSSIGEHYHSTFGAIQESAHVFISAGFLQCKAPELTVFEVGFGTGLNTWLTFLESKKSGQKIRYFSVEKYPLPPEIYQSLNYPHLFNEEAETFWKIHQCSWNQETKITTNFTLYKIQGDLIELDFQVLPEFDLIYWDAFSPEKQPELWDSDLFQKIAGHTHQQGILVTYCAKGVVRRSLNQAGFETQRIPGPPGKREMLRAIKC